MSDNSARALAAAEQLGLGFEVTRHGQVRSLEEAAVARGLPPSAVIKTLVVRVTEDDYRFVLVPGDREISWPKLRALLGVSRLSMPPADDSNIRWSAPNPENDGRSTPWAWPAG